MDLPTASGVIDDFLRKRAIAVMALTGDWGVGKTWLWNDRLKANKDAYWPEKYAYVSMFGIKSIAALQTAIYLGAHRPRPAWTYGRCANWWGIRHAINAWYRGSTATYAAISPVMDNIPYAKGLSVSLEGIAARLIKEVLICIDDFERQSDVKLAEVLGLVSRLKEECGCKVVLIFNKNQVKPETFNEFQSYREKVIDEQVSFEPSSQEAFDIAFGEEPGPFRDRARTHVLALDLRNIRVLRRLKEMLDALTVSLEGRQSGVVDQVVASVVLFTLLAYVPDESKRPSLAAIHEWTNWILRGAPDPKDDSFTSRHQLWVDFLRNYGFGYVDDLDIELSKCVERGYVLPKQLEQVLQAADGEGARKKALDRYMDAWGLFHRSFLENDEEFLKEMIDTIDAARVYLGSHQINDSVRIFRELDRNDLATQAIDIYVTANASNLANLDLRSETFTNGPWDEEFERRCYEVFDRKYQSPTFATAIGTLVDGGTTEEMFAILDSAGADEYYDFFSTVMREGLRPIVKTCLGFKTSTVHPDIAAKTEQALRRIELRSPVNRLRVRGLIGPSKTAEQSGQEGASTD